MIARYTTERFLGGEKIDFHDWFFFYNILTMEGCKETYWHSWLLAVDFWSLGWVRYIIGMIPTCRGKGMGCCRRWNGSRGFGLAFLLTMGIVDNTKCGRVGHGWLSSLGVRDPSIIPLR